MRLLDLALPAIAVGIDVVLFRLRRRLAAGALALTFGLLYGTARFIEAFYRTDITHGTGLNGSQCTALVVAVASAVGLTLLSRRARAAGALAGYDTDAAGADGGTADADEEEASHGSG